MAQITLSNLAHSYLPKPTSDEDWALKEMNHVWNDGEAYALLGASGCGKSTLLNIISGLLPHSEGQILFGDTDVTNTTTAERNIAQVFQFPVVYDTMTVRQNLAFPLKNRGASAEYIRDHVTKPVVAYVAGLTAPKGRTMGHAGAIISAFGESASEKVEILSAAGVTVAENPAVIGETIAKVMEAA